ncbi:uncharacterized protein HD556DRAFT_1223274, partial [Suillus plorans]
FVKEHATRYTQLAHLPYFDLVEQIVIDPMHNLFLGLVKTHFYNIWVQNKILRPNHELAKFHDMIADFIIPSSCGKLPTDIGMPSGGSLTADQWLLLSTVYGPIIIPQLWSACLLTDASGKVLNQHLDVIQRLETQKQVAASHKADNRKSLAEAKKQGMDAYALEKARIAQEKLALAEAKKTAKLKAAAAKEAEKLRLATEKKARAAQKVSLYGSATIKPNHHYATHVADCVRNFGPLHDFWTFLFERLNKVLKSFKTNNHADGELETTFFHEFQKTCQTSRLVSFRAYFPKNSD